MPLTDVKCRTVKATDKPLKMADGAGLYLLVKTAGKYWRWDYRHAGKRKTMALGVYPETSLADARAAMAKAREMLAAGADPMTERATEKRRAVEEAADSFRLVALEWHKTRSARWVASTAQKSMRQLEIYVFPAFGHKPVSQVSAPDLLAMLRKAQSAGVGNTAVRLREICGQVFRFAIIHGRATYNPAADLVGAIEAPAVQHRPALTDRRTFGQFLRDLAAYTSADRLTLLATRLALLTFVRSGELRLARWDEVDFDAAEWRIPAGRMKMAKGSNQAHVVPLAPQALAVLHELRALTGHGPLIFPSNHTSRETMSENTIGLMLKRMGYGGRQTLHGFRASARSLLSERGWSVPALERQLDHAERSKVVAAYARSEHLDERRRMMADWGALVSSMEAGENVVPLVRAA